MTLSITKFYHYAECHYAECYIVFGGYAKCRYDKCYYDERRGAIIRGKFLKQKDPAFDLIKLIKAIPLHLLALATFGPT
jgi:hypothetical protein